MTPAPFPLPEALASQLTEFYAGYAPAAVTAMSGYESSDPHHAAVVIRYAQLRAWAECVGAPGTGIPATELAWLLMRPDLIADPYRAETLDAVDRRWHLVTDAVQNPNRAVPVPVPQTH